MKFYIYKIINKLNGKCYVGKHKTFDGETFRAYMGSGIALVEAQRKYGIANFDKEIIEEIFPIIFPTGTMLNNLRDYFLCKNLPIYNNISQKITEILNTRYNR